MVKRVNTELNHLIRLLEADPYWRIRNELPEPVRSKLLQHESGIISLQNAMHDNALANERFLEDADDLRALLVAGIDLPPESLDSWQEIIESAHSCVGAFSESREVIIGLINGFRASRDEDPLNGAESTLN